MEKEIITFPKFQNIFLNVALEKHFPQFPVISQDLHDMILQFFNRSFLAKVDQLDVFEKGRELIEEAFSKVAKTYVDLKNNYQIPYNL